MDIIALIHQCAPAVAPAVVEAIMRTESGFDPLALHINGGVRVRSPPRTASQAAAWSQWLIDRGYSVDMGLMQINSGNLASLRLTTADAFDSCRNIRAGAAILSRQYRLAARAHGGGTGTLLLAISAYNTGTLSGGFGNGYVGRVVLSFPGGSRAQPGKLSCSLTYCGTRLPQPSITDSYTADSIVPGFPGGVQPPGVEGSR
jgi:type IV secretion system protein VirB1